MPQVTVVPNAPQWEPNNDPTFGLRQAVELQGILQNKQLLNQQLQQQIAYHQQMDPLEVQAKQTALEGDQFKNVQEKLLGPSTVSSSEAIASSNQSLATINALKAQAEPGILDDERQKNLMARNLVQQDLENAKQSGQYGAENLKQLVKMGPIMIQEKIGAIDEHAAMIKHLDAENGRLQQQTDLLKQNSITQEIATAASLWRLWSPTNRAAFKANPRYTGNPIVDAMPVLSNDPTEGATEKLMEISHNPEKYQPSVVSQANELIGMMTASQNHMVKEGLIPGTGPDGKPNVTSGYVNGLQGLGSVLGAQSITPSTRPSGSTTQGTGPVDQTGTGGLADTIKAGDLLSPIKGVRTKAQTVLGFKTFSSDAGKTPALPYGPYTVSKIYPSGSGFDSEKNARAELVNGSMNLDPNATISQTKNYSSLIDNYVMSGVGLKSQSKVKKFKDAVNQMVNNNPGALTQAQIGKISQLVQFFDEGDGK